MRIQLGVPPLANWLGIARCAIIKLMTNEDETSKCAAPATPTRAEGPLFPRRRDVL
jgi:hypothetical protein